MVPEAYSKWWGGGGDLFQKIQITKNRKGRSHLSYDLLPLPPSPG